MNIPQGQPLIVEINQLRQLQGRRLFEKKGNFSIFVTGKRPLLGLGDRKTGAQARPRPPPPAVRVSALNVDSNHKLPFHLPAPCINNDPLIMASDLQSILRLLGNLSLLEAIGLEDSRSVG